MSLLLDIVRSSVIAIAKVVVTYIGSMAIISKYEEYRSAKRAAMV